MARNFKRGPRQWPDMSASEQEVSKYLEMLRGQISSGSGGGNFFADAKDWYESTFPGNFVAVFGIDAYSCLSIPTGTRAATIFGGDLRFVVDPVGLAGAMLMGPAGPTYPFGKIAWDLLTGIGGATDLILGRGTGLVYGVKRDVLRGAHLDCTSSASDEDALPGKIIGSLIAAITFTSIMLADFYKDETAWEHTLAKWGLSGIPNRLTALLVGIETKMAVAEAALETAQAAQAKLDLAAELEAQLKPGLIAAATTEAEAAANLAVEAAEQARAALPNRNIMVDGNYTLRAQNIDIVGRGPVTEEDDLWTASTVTINAQGGGPYEENGRLILTASQQASMTTGPASVQVVRAELVGTIIANAGAVGSVMIQQGEPDIGSRASFTPLGVTIATGPVEVGPCISLTEEGMTLSYGVPNVGPTIKLGPTGLQLRFGEWSFMMTPDGIVLEVAESMYAMTPTGVNTNALMIENTGQTTSGNTNTILELVADAENTVGGALVSIGPG